MECHVCFMAGPQIALANALTAYDTRVVPFNKTTAFMMLRMNCTPRTFIVGGALTMYTYVEV